MKRSACTRLLATACALALTHLPSTAAACAVCMGDPNSKTAGAINGAIFLLLGFIGGVLGLLVVFGLTLVKRAAAPLPPHAEFSQPD
ncbi:MAG: hypothetical protein K8R23_03645 [Chthoniobacter sp.]|nr:hypothetical protein [Chthoniobacter sp.]